MVTHDAEQLVGHLRCTCSAQDGSIKRTWTILLVAEDDEAQVGLLPLGVLADRLVHAAILAKHAGGCWSESV